jgi:hypothetical protein
VQLATTASISRVKTWSCNVKEVLVEVCIGTMPTKWEKLYETSGSKVSSGLPIYCAFDCVDRGGRNP